MGSGMSEMGTMIMSLQSTLPRIRTPNRALDFALTVGAAVWTQRITPRVTMPKGVITPVCRSRGVILRTLPGAAVQKLPASLTAPRATNEVPKWTHQAQPTRSIQSYLSMRTRWLAASRTAAQLSGQRLHADTLHISLDRSPRSFKVCTPFFWASAFILGPFSILNSISITRANRND